MAKVRTLSRKFMKGHPKEGKPTYFVEQFLNSRCIEYTTDTYLQMLLRLNENKIASGQLTFEDIESFWLSLQPMEGIKKHTLRGGKHFKEGDIINLRVWHGKPYRSSQISIYHTLKVESVWDIELSFGMSGIKINGEWDFEGYNALLNKLATNDGLNKDDFKNWFKGSLFAGQIICWDGGVRYNSKKPKGAFKSVLNIV